ncbi:MAG: alpha/beta fold hydrolase [Erythrobacter sp.]
MKRSTAIFGAALAAALVAPPLLAQRGNLPSRQCLQEIRSLCPGDRSEIRACLQQRSSELSADCSAEVRERAQQRFGQRNQSGERQLTRAPAKVEASIFYGADRRQVLDYYEPVDGPQTYRWDELSPLVIFIHGGGWKLGDHKTVHSKAAHFTQAGYAFASTGYRVVPDVRVEDQVRDVAAGIDAIRARAGDFGFDPNRIVLIGHSSGAHVAALISTDPQFAGDAFSAISGVILLDGAGYEIASSMAQARAPSRRLYTDVFGSDPARQSALSPVTHVGGPDAPNWLALYVSDRERSKDQSNLLVSQLNNEGANAVAVAIEDSGHAKLNRQLGTSEDAATELVDAFLAQIFPNQN